MLVIESLVGVRVVEREWKEFYILTINGCIVCLFYGNRYKYIGEIGKNLF